MHCIFLLVGLAEGRQGPCLDKTLHGRRPEHFLIPVVPDDFFPGFPPDIDVESKNVVSGVLNFLLHPKIL